MKFKQWFCKYYPLVAAFIFEFATIGQIVRMLREHTAAGQEPLSWILVAAGLFGFGMWYHYTVPDQKFAKWAAFVSAGINIVACLVSVYFRFNQ